MYAIRLYAQRVITVRRSIPPPAIFLFPVRMTAQAIIKIANIFFLVLFHDLTLVVAGITGPLSQRWLVTG